MHRLAKHRLHQRSRTDTSGGRTRAQRHLQSLPAAAAPHEHSASEFRLPLVEGNFSRIAKYRELTILLFAGAICFSFPLLSSTAAGSWHSSLPDRGLSDLASLLTPLK